MIGTLLEAKDTHERLGIISSRMVRGVSHALDGNPEYASPEEMWLFIMEAAEACNRAAFFYGQACGSGVESGETIPPGEIEAARVHLVVQCQLVLTSAALALVKCPWKESLTLIEPDEEDVKRMLT